MPTSAPSARSKNRWVPHGSSGRRRAPSSAGASDSGKPDPVPFDGDVEASCEDVVALGQRFEPFGAGGNDGDVDRGVVHARDVITSVKTDGSHEIAQCRNLHLVCSPWSTRQSCLRQQGLNVTAQRLAVLRAVGGQPHLTADDVVERRQGRHRVDLPSRRLRRRRGPGRHGPAAAHPTGRVGGALRGSRGRQPPPPDLSRLRPHGGRRLRRRRGAVLDGGRRRRLPDRRSRGHLLGPLPDLSARRRRPPPPADTISNSVNSERGAT